MSGRSLVIALSIVAAASIAGVALATADAPVRLDGKVADDCTVEGKPLYGRVKVVESFPDFEVRVVESFPDLRVKTVDSFPDECGRWKLVESFPDFTITYVESFPDFTIKHVDSFPGVP